MGLLAGSALDQGPSALSPALIRATKAPPGSRRSPLPYITDSTSLPLNARLGLHTGDGLMTQGPSNSVLVPEADEGVIGCWPVQSAEGRSQCVAVHVSVDADSRTQDAQRMYVQLQIASGNV